MGALNDIFSGRHYLPDGSHIDLLPDQGVESHPDQYATQPTLFEGASPPSTPKIHPWEPPTDIDPAKRTPHPDPNTNLAQKTHWNNRWQVRNVFRDHLAEHDMPDEDKSAFMSNIHDTLSAIPAGAMTRLARGLKSARVYSSFNAHRRSYVDTMHAIERSLDAQSINRPLRLKNKSPDDHGAAAHYDPDSRTVHLPFAKDAIKTALVAGKVTPSQIYLHELAHAVDHSPDTPIERAFSEDDDDLSGSNEWLKAYRDEMARGRLNEYATHGHSEAFAEFARLVWTQPSVAKTHFPQAYAFFKANNLTDPEDAEKQSPKSVRFNVTKRLRVPTQETTV